LNAGGPMGKPRGQMVCAPLTPHITVRRISNLGIEESFGFINEFASCEPHHGDKMPTSLLSCRACAKAKRRCGRQEPHCLRCRKRGVQCLYPPAKPSRFRLLTATEDAESPIELENLSSTARTLIWKHRYQSGSSQDDTSPEDTGSETLASVPSLELSPEQVLTIHHELVSSWFASRETWQVTQPPPPPAALVGTFSDDSTKPILEHIRRWFVQWVDTGSSPFIHAQVYRRRFPRAMQDAYMALTCYLHKTTSSRPIVFRLMEQRIKVLVGEAARPAGAPGARAGVVDLPAHRPLRRGHPSTPPRGDAYPDPESVDGRDGRTGRANAPSGRRIVK
jgi:hypothetical protein